MVRKKSNNQTRQSNRAVFSHLKLKSEVFKMAKIGTQKTIEVEGIEYTLQHPGSRANAQIQDRTMTDKGIPSMEKTAEEIFKHVIVNPKVSFEHFDEHDGYDEVLEEAMKFLRTGK